MKKVVNEFKTFITRGNIVDMAVGVIIGGAFTAIVTALCNNILRPLINAFLKLVLGANSLSDIYTYLFKEYDTEGAIDLANSIYIDWGAFINAVINFLLIAIILFFIVKTLNSISKKTEEVKKNISKVKLSKEDIKELKARDVNIFDKEKVSEYLKEKEEKRIAEEEAKKKEEEEKAKKERLENPTTEDLLKDIKALLEKQASK